MSGGRYVSNRELRNLGIPAAKRDRVIEDEPVATESVKKRIGKKELEGIMPSVKVAKNGASKSSHKKPPADKNEALAVTITPLHPLPPGISGVDYPQEPQSLTSSHVAILQTLKSVETTLSLFELADAAIAKIDESAAIINPTQVVAIDPEIKLSLEAEMPVNADFLALEMPPQDNVEMSLSFEEALSGVISPTISDSLFTSFSHLVNHFEIFPLHEAILTHNVALLESMLNKGVHNVNAENSIGATPLYLATVRGSIKMVEMLLKHEADVNLESSLGLVSPMCYAYNKIAEASKDSNDKNSEIFSEISLLFCNHNFSQLFKTSL